MKKNWRIILAAGLVTLLFGCGSESKPEAKGQMGDKAAPAASKVSAQADKTAPRSCQLTMGFDVWEPYQFIGFGREIQGLDVELIEMIADKLDCDVQYQQDSWGNLLSLLKGGKIDFVLGASMTEDRKAYALFSDPYRSEEFQLYVRADEEHNHRQASVVDFVKDNNSLGIIGGYYYGDELTAMMDDDKYAGLFNSAFMGEINVARLIDGDIDGFLEDSFVGASLIRRKGLERYVTPHQASIKTGDVYVMFSKATIKPDMLQRFNAALKEIKSNGQYDKLVNKYSG